MKLLSVIIPVYNAEKYLERCWLSLHNQSYTNCEFIFVDDCSTDDSRHLLETFAVDDKRVRVVSCSQNGGVSIARNRGIELAGGEYLTFCDADDYVEYDMYLNMINSLERHCADIATCGVLRESEDGAVFNELFQCENEVVYTTKEAIKEWLLGRTISNSFCTKIIRKELFGDLRFPEREIFEEAYVLPKLFLKSNKVVHAAISPYHYIDHPNSLSTGTFSEQKLVVYERERYIEGLVSSKYPELCDEILSFQVRNNISVFYSAIYSNLPVRSSVYRQVRREVLRLLFPALCCKLVGKKSKLQLLELTTGIALIRRRYLKRI